MSGLEPRGRARTVLGPFAVLLIGLTVTAVTVVTVWYLHEQNERRLLSLQVEEAGVVLEASSRTNSVALLTAATMSTDDEAFERAADVLLEQGLFAGLRRWERVDGQVAVTATVGDATGTAEADRDGLATRAVAAREQGTVALFADLDAPGRHLGLVAAAGPDGPFVYAESPLPDVPTGLPRSVGPFGDLEFAIYLGEARDRDHILVTSAGTVPMPGEVETTVVRFADGALLLVASTDRSFGGTFGDRLPAVVALIGVVLAAGAASATRVLQVRRAEAEALAGENAGLFEEQRSRTDTLRTSLLPSSLSPTPGWSVALCHLPADQDDQVSGDFYDIVPTSDSSMAVVVGDVCGKGIDAAAVTGLVRHTVRAAARHETDPTEVVHWVHEALELERGDTYCTIAYAAVTTDLQGATVELVLGGHPRPLLLRDGHAEPIGEHGSIVGMVQPAIRPVRHRLAFGDTLVLFTDGVHDVVTGGLSPDDFAALIASAPDQRAQGIADHVESHLRRLRPDGSSDDTVVMVLRLDGTAHTDP